MSSNEKADSVKGKYLRRLKDLETERKPFEDEWQDVTDFILPRRAGWDKKPSSDKSGTAKIYDGTALAALTLMCDGLLGHLVPASIPFFRLKSSIAKLEDIPIFRDWMDRAEIHLLAAIERSNFFEALGELFPDSGGLGTGVMYMEEDIVEGRIFFSVRHLKEVFIAENRWGVVDTAYRKFQMSYINLIEQFPDAGKKLKEKAEKTPYASVEVLHVVEPGKTRPFDSTYILLDSGDSDDKDSILEQGGFDYFPYIVWRFRKNSEEVYGRSPAMDALFDVKMINFMAKSLAEAAHKAVNPPLLLTEDMRGKIKTNPGAHTYVDGHGVSGQVASLYGGALGQYPIGIDAYERRAKMIREHFRSDFFSYLLAESAGNGGQRTATEVNAIEAQKAAVLGSTIGRVTKELFEPVIRNMFAIEYLSQRLPEVPQQLEELVGAPLSIEYTGPLARKQRQYLRTSDILDGVQGVFGLAQAKPEVLDNFNWDYIATESADAAGMPQAGMFDPKDVAKMREARAKQQQEMQQIQMQMEQAKLNPALSKGPEPNSPAERQMMQERNKQQ